MISSGTWIKRICTLMLCVCIILSVSFFSYADTVPGPRQQRLDELFTTEDLLDAPISELIAAMEEGRITSEALVGMYLERIKTYDKQLTLNSFITVNPNALDEARAADEARAKGESGKLLGIPIAVKDNIDVKGLPTTNGYSGILGYKASADSTAVSRLRAEGAVIIGKCNMSAGSMSGTVTRSSSGGVSHNPYDITRTPAGSSGGSAIAVTCNFAAAALGSDTNSSIRRPASFANIYGYRPSAGLVSRKGLRVTHGLYDTVGILARTADDTALILDIISGTDSADRYSSSADQIKNGTVYSESLDSVPLQGIKIGYVSNSFGYYVNGSGKAVSKPTELSDAVKGMVDDALEVFTANGAELVDVSEYFTEPFIRRLKWRSAANARKAVKEAFGELGISALVYVSQTDVPEIERKAIGRYDNPSCYINIFSPAVGLPEIMVPMGLSGTDPDRGVTEPMALGLSIVGLYGEDASLLAIASKYNRLSDMRHMPSAVPALADSTLEQFAEELLAEADGLLSAPDLSQKSFRQITDARNNLAALSMSEEEGKQTVSVSMYRNTVERLCMLMDSAEFSETQPEEDIPAQPEPDPETEPFIKRYGNVLLITGASTVLLIAAIALLSIGLHSGGPSDTKKEHIDSKDEKEGNTEMKKPVLVIMAAGMGSRFGGLKQIAPVDDSGHIIMDYSLYDAKRAGFEKVVFVIKKELEADFRTAIGDRIAGSFDVSYVFQDISDLPEGFSVPEGRVKPWGTGHAVASCRDVIDAPFAVINADDFYGRSAFEMIYRFLSGPDESGRYGMVGFRLRNTLTENGSVARGQCSVENGLLTDVTERTEIYPRGNDAEYRAEDGSMVEISGDTVVSMNFWGFSSDMAKTLWERFPAYLEAGLAKDPVKFEYYLPSVVNDQIKDGTCTVTVLTCEDSWHGVTYTDDLPDLKKAISRMREDGTYPVSLWN